MMPATDPSVRQHRSPDFPYLKASTGDLPRETFLELRVRNKFVSSTSLDKSKSFSRIEWRSSLNIAALDLL